jgi:glycosyltransferase involved in cell wall biosynthesis
VRIALLAHLHHPIAEPFAGGMEMHTAMVADELVRRGHAVTLFAREGSRTQARLVPILGADFVYGKVPHSHTRQGILDAAVRRALADLGNGDFDVVLNNSLSALPYHELDAWPMLTVLHTPPTLAGVNAVIEAPGWRPGRRHSFVAVSRHTARSWRSRLPSVSCIPNGVQLERWQPRPGPDPGLAVWSARITPEKGLHLAVDAARKAGLRLEICGSIADPAYFAQHIEPRLGPGVIYRGHLNHQDLAATIARAAVFLATPLWAEPFGLAMVEAMACGTPVAALPNGACTEVVLPAGGVVSAKVSSGSLATAVRAARKLDRARVHRHAQRFDAATMIDRYEDMMLRMAEAPAVLAEALPV